MWLLILEATAAFFIFAFIIWWTMFSGRKPEHFEPEKKSEKDLSKTKSVPQDADQP
jgi:cytoskeletal protein RodZ